MDRPGVALGSGDHNNLLGAELSKHQPLHGLGSAKPPDHQIKLAASESRRQVGVGSFVDLEECIGVPFQEGRNGGRQKARGHTWQNPYIEVFLGIATCSHAAKSMTQGGRRLLCELQEYLTFLGQFDAGPVSLHEVGAQDPLEFLERLGDGRLRQVQLGSGLLETAGAGDCAEGVEMPEFDASVHYFPIKETQNHFSSFFMPFST
jgi:hypothetical protein